MKLKHSAFVPVRFCHNSKVCLTMFITYFVPAYKMGIFFMGNVTWRPFLKLQTWCHPGNCMKIGHLLSLMVRYVYLESAPRCLWNYTGGLMFEHWNISTTPLTRPNRYTHCQEWWNPSLLQYPLDGRWLWLSCLPGKQCLSSPKWCNYLSTNKYFQMILKYPITVTS